MAIPKKQPVKKALPLKPLQPKGPFHFKGITFHLIFICFVIGLCSILYGNTVPNGFSLDDEFVLHNDSTVAKGIKGIPELFTKRYAWDQKGGYGYRPVVKATFAVEYQFFKESAHWGHVINILFYAFVCIFLFYFFRKLLYEHVGDYFLLIALLLYIVHPLHSEVVASLKNRDEMLVLIFGFYCCFGFLKCFEAKEIPMQVLWGFSACLSLGLAALCKPDGFIFIPITVLILYFFTPKEKKISPAVLGVFTLLLLLPLLLIWGKLFLHLLVSHFGQHTAGPQVLKIFYTWSVVVCVAAILLFFAYKYMRKSEVLRVPFIAFVSMVDFIMIGNRFVIQNVLPHTEYHRTFIFIENPLVGVAWYHKIPLAFSTIYFYISKMLFPKDLVSYYGYDAFNAFPSWIDFSVIAGILIVGFLIYFLIINIKKKGPVLLLLLLFGGTLLPYTDIFQVGAGIVAERFMFIPSVFFILLLTYLLFAMIQLPVDKKPMGNPAMYVYVLISLVCLVSTLRVIARNPDWKTHQSLYAHDVKEAPRSAKLQSLLAATYIEEAQKLKALNPPPRARIDSLFTAGDNSYQNSLDIYPQYGTTWNNKGMIQYTLYGNLRNAIADFKNALKIDTAYSEAWFNMGACEEAVAQRINDTITALQKDSTALVEGTFYGRETEASINKKLDGCRIRLQQNRDDAENSYLHTIALKPKYYQAYFYLTRVYFGEARYDKEIVFDSNVIKQGNQNDMVYVTMGNAYMMMHETQKAITSYETSFKYFDKNYVVCNILKKYYTKKGDTVKSRYYSRKLDSAMMIKNGQIPAR